VTSLNLTPNLLAGIFLSQTILNRGTVPDYQYAVPSWNTPAVLALNPGLGTTCGPGVADILPGDWSDSIFPVARQDATPENEALASFFAAAAPTVWHLYLSLTNNSGYTPSYQFPWDPTNLTSNGYLVPNESAQMADLVGGNNDFYNTLSFQTMTYMTTADLAKEEASFTSSGLTPAVVNLVPNSVTTLPSAGVTPVSPSIAAVASALGGLRVGSDGTYTADYSFSTGSQAWPIPMISYLVVPTNNLARASAGPLSELLNFAVSATGQADLTTAGWPGPGSAGADTYGYTPLSRSLVGAAQAVANAVAAEGSSPHTGSTTTTTTATSIATTVPLTPQAAGNIPSTPTGSPLGSGGGLPPAVSTGVSAGVGSSTAGGARAATFAGGQVSGKTGLSAQSADQSRVFIAEGTPLASGAFRSVAAEAFGTAGPWLLAVGGAGLFAGLLQRRREIVGGVTREGVTAK
jgi:hypothetical protein